MIYYTGLYSRKLEVALDKDDGGQKTTLNGPGLHMSTTKPGHQKTEADGEMFYALSTPIPEDGTRR